MCVSGQVRSFNHSHRHRWCCRTGRVSASETTIKNTPHHVHSCHAGPIHEVAVPAVSSSGIGAVTACIYLAYRYITVVGGVVVIATLVVKVTIVFIAVLVLCFNDTVAVQVRVFVVSLVKKLVITRQVEHHHGCAFGLCQVRWQWCEVNGLCLKGQQTHG